MSGRDTSRPPTEGDTDSEGSARTRRRRPVRRGSSTDTIRHTITAEGSSEDRPRRYRSPERNTTAHPTPTSGVGRQGVAAAPRRYRSPDRSDSANIAATRGGDGRRSTVGSAAVTSNTFLEVDRAAKQGNRPTPSAGPGDIDGELQRALEASSLERQEVVPVVKDFDPDDIEETLRKSKEEHDAAVKREEEEAEREYQEHLRYVKADGEAIKALDAQKAASKLRKLQEQEEAKVQIILKESLAAEVERQATENAKLDALYASFGKSNDDVPSPRAQAVYASQSSSPTPAVPPSRALSTSAVERTTPSSSGTQQPQRSPSVRQNQSPVQSPARQSTTSHTASASGELGSPHTGPVTRQPASSYATPVTRQQASPSRTTTVRQSASSHVAPTPRSLERSRTTATSRQPNPAPTRQPRRVPAATETIAETDEADEEFLAAIRASNETHLTDQAQRGAATQAQWGAAVQAQEGEVDEAQFAATLQAALAESLGGAEEADVTDTGLSSPPPSYSEVFKDKVLNHEKYTSAGGPEGSPPPHNTTKKIPKKNPAT